MIKLTNFFKQRLNNFKQIPKNIRNLMTNQLSKNANDIMFLFKTGILNDKLSLARLKKRTIYVKKKSKMRYPTRPLVGKGNSNKDSYANMMVATKIINGVKIAPKNNMHHSDKISLAKLFLAHEDAQRLGTPKRQAMQKVIDNYSKEQDNVVIDPITFNVRIIKK